MDDNTFVLLSAFEITHDVELVALFDVIVDELCWTKDVGVVEVECFAGGTFVVNWLFIEKEEVVDDDEEGLSAEDGKEFTSTAESGVSARAMFAPLWLVPE